MKCFLPSSQTSRQSVRRGSSDYMLVLFLSINPNLTDNFLFFCGDNSVINLVTWLSWQHLSYSSINYSPYPLGHALEKKSHICVVWTLQLEEGWHSCVTNSTSVALEENSHLRRCHLTPKCAPVSSNTNNNNTTTEKGLRNQKRDIRSELRRNLTLDMARLPDDPSFRFIGWISNWRWIHGHHLTGHS